MNSAESSTPSLGRILIADDEESFLLSIATLLRREGYTCDCAADAHEAAKLLQTETYDLLISDIRMPGNQDLDLIHQVPALNAGLPVILVTGYPSMPTAMQALQLPVLAYLVKPTDFQELASHVKRGIAFRRVASSMESSTGLLERWVGDMKTLRTTFQASPQAAAQGTLNGALALAMGNMAGTLLELQTLFKLGTGLGAGRMECNIQNCPKLAIFEQTIQESIELLEKTKDSFHSRQLRDLRRKLESLVEPGSAETP
jgi:DNA-binding response OmpR family regulator